MRGRLTALQLIVNPLVRPSATSLLSLMILVTVGSKRSIQSTSAVNSSPGRRKCGSSLSPARRAETVEEDHNVESSCPMYAGFRGYWLQPAMHPEWMHQKNAVLRIVNTALVK
jgi:hypothetical protein